MTLSLIAAVAKNRAIGYHNKLLFAIKEDMEHFKRLTMGHVIIMGRHTFESLPNGALPHRKNIVISKSQTVFKGCTRVSSFEEALAMCQKEAEVFVIGGEQVYKEAISQADKLYLTEIDALPKQADAFFPAYDDWQLVAKEEHKKGKSNSLAFAFSIYHRC
ncbi:MAG: dihydrofolate reductase [Prevotella salivae]|nr:dihydrofolate reductase [Segatella salivae]